MHLLNLLTLVLYPLTISALLAQENLLLLAPHDSCDCTNITKTTVNTTFHICHNASLGPQTLPWRFPMLSFVSNYDRFGNLTPLDFLTKWGYYNATINKWRWNYPPQDGFHLDAKGDPIRAFMTLRKGLKVDRFGAESGSFIAAADSPFNQRALPPDALNVCPDPNDCRPRDHPWNYHIYEVLQDFQVIGGPIAPAFEQDGLGTQFQLFDKTTGKKASLTQFVDWGFLKRLNLNKIELGPGPSSPGACGKAPVNCTCDKPN